MTKDEAIFDALRAFPMSGAEIGRAFAPETIKDREGWGRKWVAKNQKVLVATERGWRFHITTGLLNRAQELLHSWLGGGYTEDRYKAPHAPRGTPPRPHHPKGTL